MATRAETRRRRLAVPITAFVLGALACAALVVGGDARDGAVSFGIMAVYGVGVYLLAGRSDVVSVLAGDPPDERYQAIDQRALAGVGLVLILYVIGGFLWEQARGRSGMPFTLMGAVAALTYLAGLVYGRVRG